MSCAAECLCTGSKFALMLQDFRIFSPTSEAINGRAAMLGFAIAVVTEVATGAVLPATSSRWDKIRADVTTYIPGPCVGKCGRDAAWGHDHFWSVELAGTQDIRHLSGCCPGTAAD